MTKSPQDAVLQNPALSVRNNGGLRETSHLQSDPQRSRESCREALQPWSRPLLGGVDAGAVKHVHSSKGIGIPWRLANIHAYQTVFAAASTIESRCNAFDPCFHVSRRIKIFDSCAELQGSLQASCSTPPAESIKPDRKLRHIRHFLRPPSSPSSLIPDRNFSPLP